MWIRWAWPVHRTSPLCAQIQSCFAIPGCPGKSFSCALPYCCGQEVVLGMELPLDINRVRLAKKICVFSGYG